jgi:hypothetical protein
MPGCVMGRDFGSVLICSASVSDASWRPVENASWPAHRLSEPIYSEGDCGAVEPGQRPVFIVRQAANPPHRGGLESKQATTGISGRSGGAAIRHMSFLHCKWIPRRILLALERGF